MLMKAIGYKAEGVDQNGKYDCSFMIIYPIGAVSEQEVQNMEANSITQFHQMHPTGQIQGRMERTLMGHPGTGPNRGPGPYGNTSEYA